MKHLLSAVILALIALAAPAVQAQIVVPEALSQAGHGNWRAIGRIDVRTDRGTATCTGTLVTTTTVLTAAHCVLSDRTGKVVDPGRLTFNAGLYRGRAVARATARAIDLPRNFTVKSQVSQSDIWADLAVITLAAPITGIAPIPVARRGLKSEFRVLGYRFDRPDVMTDYRRCYLLRGGGRALRLSCGVASGTSGAPVLFQTATGWATAGVISSGNDFEVIAAPVSPDMVR